MPAPSTTNSSLTMNDVLNARQNLSTIDLALGEIRRLLEEKEKLEADVAALQRQKEELTQDVRFLRDAGSDHDVPSTTRSLPDLSLNYDSDSSEKVAEDENEGMTRSERKSNAPQHFLCPLTLEIMRHPMQQKDTENNYERGAILEWIYFGKATCPLTRRVLHPGDFQENRALQREIEQWRKKNGMEDYSVQEMDSSEQVAKLTAEEEKKHQRRLAEIQIKRNGSHKELLGLREKVLKKRDARVRRRMSQF